MKPDPIVGLTVPVLSVPVSLAFAPARAAPELCPATAMTRSSSEPVGGCVTNVLTLP
jgi:hypothetical protein